jgi:hypothetical protein
MPELLTRRKTPNPSPAGWPASNRNGGRIYFGTVADIKSERRPASRRNTWPASIGIRRATQARATELRIKRLSRSSAARCHKSRCN